MNGYFRLNITNTSTNLELFAPTDGGTSVQLNDVLAYLIEKGITYDNGSLAKAVDESALRNTSVTLNMSKTLPVNEMEYLTVSQDKMVVTTRLYPPSNGGSRMSVDEIKKDLVARGVKFGIKEDVIEDLIANPVYCENIVIAEGLAPEESKDGYIEYLFNTDRKQKPTLLEDGSVDFFHLNVVQSCGTGQELARLYPEYKGEDGTAVDGSIVRSRDPKKATLKHGANIHVSEDGRTLISDTDGNVALVGDTVFVNSSLTFNGVGTATGNIEFEGSVVIEGNIETNFEVRVKGDVTVNGIIEGAYVEAGGNIIVSKGVNGMGKAVLKAGGNIIAKYLENVEASASGYISAEAIMHSNVSAGGEIIVDGRKGMISGGHATAGGTIQAKTLGSEMANETVVEVGISPAVKREILELRNQLAEKQKTLNSIVPVLNNLALKIKSGAVLSNDQKVYVSKLMTAQKTTNEEINNIQTRLFEMEELFNVDVPAEILVKGVVYPGTKVCISDVSMVVKTACKYCKFVKLRGDVKIASYD